MVVGGSDRVPGDSGVEVAMERGQDNGDQRREDDCEAESGDSGIGASGLRDDGTVRLVDPEQFNAAWSVVRPGVDYIDGNAEARRAGAAVREVYEQFTHRSPLDAMQMMTDADGNPYLVLYLGAELVHEVVTVIRAGLCAVADES
jgi:hypothetical protein